MADIPTSFQDWSDDPAANQPEGSDTVGTGIAPNYRAIQAAIRLAIASRTTLASAATVDLLSVDEGSVDITGTTTITSFGAVSADQVGMRYLCTALGVFTITFASSLDLPTGASITTAVGDSWIAEAVTGGWKVHSYQRYAGTALVATPEFLDGTEGTPGIRWASDLNTGFYRIGADNIGLSLGGTKRIDFSTSLVLSTVPVRTGEGTSLSAVGLQVGAADRGLWYDSGAGLMKQVFNSTSVLQWNGTTVTVPVALTVSGATTLQGATSLNGAVAFGSSAPTLSGGGTGPSITGTRNQARVTIGTGSPTTFTLTWANTAANVTAHVMSDQAGITWTVTTGRSGGGLTDAYVQFSASAALTSGTICQVLASFGN